MFGIAERPSIYSTDEAPGVGEYFSRNRNIWKMKSIK